MNPGQGPESIRKFLRPKTIRPTVFWRIAEDIPPRLNTTLMLLSIAIPLLLWWLVTAIWQTDPKFLPSPVQVLEAFRSRWDTGELLRDTIASLWRVSVGFFMAAAVSIPVGILMGSFASIRALLEPLFGLVRYMPAPAFIPLLIIYMGIGEEPKIALIFIGVFFFNALMVMDAVKFVPKDLIESTFILGGNRIATLFQVILPYVLPGILDAFRINFAAAWQLVVVCEMVAASDGLGRRIMFEVRGLHTDVIFANLIVIGIIGLSYDLLFRLLLHFSCQWANQKR
jgi:NitT/TauT family transport system permease protein